MSPVEFMAPATIEAAVAALAAGPGAVPVGGATALSLLMKEGLLEPNRLVWLGRIPEWEAITTDDGVVRIAGGTTLAGIARSEAVRAAAPALAAAAGVAANPRVRAVATIGGHLAHADPRQDLPPVLLAVGATAIVHGPHGERRVPVDDLLVGFYETSLGDAELVTEVQVPVSAGAQQVYARFNPGSADDYATVSVAVQVDVDQAGQVGSVRLAAGGCGGRAVLLREAAALAAGRAPSDIDMHAVQAAVEAEFPAVDDHRGSKAYKRRVAGVWARRALISALEGGGPLLVTPIDTSSTHHSIREQR